MSRAFYYCILMLCLSGCAVNSLFVSYPAQMAPIKQQLNSNQPQKALSTLKETVGNNSGNDSLLYHQEAGRLAQINGDFSTSKKYYAKAIADYQAFDDKAIISASNIGSSAGSLILNDNAIPYQGAGFERIMLHQYQALNYLFEKDYQGALVEVRRANALQTVEQEKYRQSQQNIAQMDNGQVNTEIDKLNEQVKDASNSFINAYSYYITGLLYELSGQSNDAFIDYRKAAQLSPSNPYLKQTLLRLAKTLAMPQYKQFQQQWGKAEFPASNEGQLILIVERGFVPEKQEFTVPIRVEGHWQRITLPTYSAKNKAVSPAYIQGLGKPLTAAPIANIDTLAITALTEQMPSILLRQAGRAYTKAELNQSVAEKNPSDSFAVVAMEIFNLISEQADRRSWLTLPKQAQIATSYLKAGRYPLILDNNAHTEIKIEKHKTTLVWAIDLGNTIRFHVIEGIS